MLIQDIKTAVPKPDGVFDEKIKQSIQAGPGHKDCCCNGDDSVWRAFHAVDADSNVFATGPGGVLILSPQGKLLGRIVTGERIANVGWGHFALRK